MGWVKDKGGSGVKKYEEGGKVPKGKIGPTMREAMLHKAGLKKSRKIQRGVRKQPELYSEYKLFREEKKERRQEKRKHRRKQK